ncbi:MAG TPA: hypothetical protein VGQ55_06885, partial [Pyrinomonadaceae bacterium]|nr:hypothetical protein [Pyrinomonadaceae bacterium]
MYSSLRSAIVWLQVLVLVFVLLGVTEAVSQKVSKEPKKQPVIKNANRATETYAASNYKTSVSFAPNMGQTDSQVKYIGYGLGYGLFLTSNEAVFRFGGQETQKRNPRDRKRVKDKIDLKDSVLRMKFVNANNNPKAVPYGELSGKRNYLSKERNISGVPNYSKVEFENLYDGVALTYYSKDQSLEYDL